MNLDQELKDALKRHQPPVDLTDRVMAAINSREAAAAPSSWWKRRGLQLAAAASIIVVVGAGVVRQRAADRERERGEAAARQLVTGLRIASEALSAARNEIRN